MNTLQVLGLLQLLAAPAFSLTQPTHDYWGEFGAYGPCSRTCGTGVAMRTRKCVTSRTDGGHNCAGSTKSYRACNTQDCPAGARDFREEQCAQFDGVGFQSKSYSWVPYYGATNPCELNCVPRGENFFYRQRPNVVDGTQCYVGRSDICIDGVCRVLTPGDIMGLDENAPSARAPPSAPGPVPIAPYTHRDIYTHSREPQYPYRVTPYPHRETQYPGRETQYPGRETQYPGRDTHTYVYTTGVFSVCSVTCNGGMQYRTVDCVAQDPGPPHVVDDSYCVGSRLQRPASQQACNMHPCGAVGYSTGGAGGGATGVGFEYTVSSFSVCSVTCGEGQQTREVFCVGSRGERLAEHACAGMARPASVQVCRRPACTSHITWHVTDFGLCTRSCGGGMRERRVSCLDTDLNPYAEDRCGPQPRPSTVESCNSQPCPGAQLVPSVQDPRAHESTMRGYVPYTGEASAPGPRTNVVYDPYTAAIGPHCTLSYYGCCPDGRTAAGGPRNEGCAHAECAHSRYGCCLDGVTAAQGVGRAGCPEYVTPVVPDAAVGDACSLRRDEGPCDTWKVRFYYDSATAKCTEFWYGGCQGNTNNFMTLDACQRRCASAAPVRVPPPTRVTPRRRSATTTRRVRSRA